MRGRNIGSNAVYNDPSYKGGQNSYNSQFKGVPISKSQNWLHKLSQAELDETQSKVVQVVHRYVFETPKAIPSVTAVTGLSGLTDIEVFDALVRLKDLGLVEITASRRVIPDTKFKKNKRGSK